MTLWRKLIISTIGQNTFKQEVARKCLHNYTHKNVNITSQALNLNPINVTYNTVRCKTKKQYDSDDEDIKFDEDSSLSKDSKVVKFSTTSMRADVILKSALSVSRNKVEQMFYESKIRINGRKILKKSASVKIGDEVDVIKMVSPNNSDHLYVSRVEILNVAPKEESISVTARRFKHLLIDNYEDNPHKSAVENQ
ncbi:unnamed protein product [Arctia plantaginis]|uniref:Mitochondrial transcription rescue factor 1 C-terminal domain-containing protein n=1 Tax=Arctia plantaginis TaxID=874455 RepID=A0A8S1ARA6_ARCPL|nr:unnamed protein product [Arctia plantaginis]